jgi:hypothetical protein
MTIWTLYLRDWRFLEFEAWDSLELGIWSFRYGASGAAIAR